jgi:hypothetical protein
MKLSTFLFVFLSSWKATNAFLPLQPRAFTPATTKPTTSSSLNAFDGHENVADYRKGMSESRGGLAMPGDVRTWLHPYPYYLYGGGVFYQNLSLYSFIVILHYAHSIEH